MRAEPAIPPEEEVQLQPVALNKWRVESIQASKGRDGNNLTPKPTEVVKASKSARLRPAHCSMTAFKASQRRKIRELLLSQVKNVMKKKMVVLKKKKSKPEVNYSF